MVEKINSGFKPIVEINDNILSEQYLKSGMKAQVVSANHIINESGDYIIFLLDYSDFDIHNSSLKNLGLHSHISIDVDEKSDSLKEEVFYFFDTQNNIPFDIV